MPPVFILARHFSKCQRSFNAEIQKAATITINALTMKAKHIKNIRKKTAEPTTGAVENPDIGWYRGGYGVELELTAAHWIVPTVLPDAFVTIVVARQPLIDFSRFGFKLRC